MSSHYKSTRGEIINIDDCNGLLKGIAEDGGLFVKEGSFEKFNIEDFLNLKYEEMAYKILHIFFDFNEEDLKEAIKSAYSKFSNKEITPLKILEDRAFIELYHGPTGAFKDIALTLLPYLMKLAMRKQSIKDKILILTATSGDTGKAALEGFKDIEGIKIMVFYPKYGVSDAQRYQMITQEGNNLEVLGINGNFDDAQTCVKSIFTDDTIKNQLKKIGYIFSSANSINIGRLFPQIVYYFYGYISLVKNGKIKLGDEINIVVPTGNFGNILSSYYAKKLGLPVKKFICASNENNVLTDFINTGVYDIKRDFYTTITPSMDILISSNLERLIYDISGEDPEVVKGLMGDLKNFGRFEINNNMKNHLSNFYGSYATEGEILNVINDVYKKHDYVLDPHTAVGQVVYNKYLEEAKDEAYALITATASPYKFAKTALKALGYEAHSKESDFEEELSLKTNSKIPDFINDIKWKKVIYDNLIEKDEIKDRVISFVLEKQC